MLFRSEPGIDITAAVRADRCVSDNARARPFARFGRQARGVESKEQQRIESSAAADNLLRGIEGPRDGISTRERDVLRFERRTGFVAVLDEQVALPRARRRWIVLPESEARANGPEDERATAAVDSSYQGISRFVCRRPISAARSSAEPIITPSVIISTTLLALTELRKKILLAFVAANTR